MLVEAGKIVSLCVTVWDAKWCKDKFKGDAARVRAVGSVTKKHSSTGEWDVKFPFPEGEVNHTIHDFLLRIESPTDVKAGTFIYDDPTTRRLYGAPDEHRETKTPLRKSADFKTNDMRVRQILTSTSLGKETKITQVADTLKAMDLSASLDAIIRYHFASVSGYVQAVTTVADKAKSMATALVDKHVAWQGIVEVETGTSVEPPTTDQDQFRAALRQREAEFKAEMDKLREENNELRTTKRHKNDGSFGQAAAALKNRLDEDEETQPEL
eukprot:g55656.t1